MPRRVSTLRFANELILYQQGVQCPYRSGLDGQRPRETRAAHVDLHVLEGEEFLLVVDFIASMISRDICRIHSESVVTLSRLAEWCKVGRSSLEESFTRGGSHHFLFLDDLALACDAVVISASSTVIIWDDRRLSVKVMERTTRRPGLVRRAGWRKDKGETRGGLDRFDDVSWYVGVSSTAAAFIRKAALL